MAARNGDSPIIVLVRRDLRIADNGALAAAGETRRPVIPVLVLDDHVSNGRALGGASRWWLHHSIQQLAQNFDRLGAPLTLRRGSTFPVVESIVDRTSATAVYWNRRFDPAEAAVDDDMHEQLCKRGVATASYDGQLLHDPAKVRTGTGNPYKVYTPFWRTLASGNEPRDPIDAPRRLQRYDGKVETENLGDWRLLPKKPDWASGLRERWTPGEAGAAERLRTFVNERLDGYGIGRDRPDQDGTSFLSPHLAFGEITPFQIFAAVKSSNVKAPAAETEKFRKEVAWREFCYHLLNQKPDLASENFNSKYDGFRWRTDRNGLKRWQSGQTGYPIVDAGMRELWATGYMHNRVRMIAASFLIKDLLIDWREGEQWFWDTLVDADPANNPGNWQWVAGSGADASPFFRIFNPVLQGKKFDPTGDYVRHWVPELAKLPPKWIHEPVRAPQTVLDAAGVKLGTTYPVPLIEHGKARDRAMHSYGEIKGTP